MPTFKQVFNFQAPVGRGWNELYYVNAGTIQEASRLDAQFLNGRLSFLWQGAILRKVRTSDVASNRSSVIASYNLPGTDASAGLPDPGADLVSTSAVCIMSSVSPASTRRVWFRGLNDANVRRDPNSGADLPFGGMITNLKTWFRYLKNNQYCIRSLTPIGTFPNIYNDITNVTGTVGAGYATLTTTGTTGIPTNGRIVVYGLSPKLYPGLNGHWKVSSFTTTTIVVKYNLLYVPPASNFPGRWRPENYQYGVIQSDPLSRFDHFGSRDTGVGFPTGRGRRRGVKLRSL